NELGRGLAPKPFLRRPTAKGVGLRVADSHTGNHPEDDFTPLETIRSSVIRKFFGQGEQVEKIPNANEGGTHNLSKELHTKSISMPRAWKLYLEKEAIEEGSGIGIILVSPEEKMYSYAIRLKFKASNYAMDCEALLAGLAAYANQEGNHTPTTEHERRYKKEIIDATILFHRFRITHLPKILNLEAEVLAGLATINLEYLNQEVSVGIKTRPSVEETSSSKKGKTTNNSPGTKLNCNREASESN
ncbi:hypothetical protein Tco_0517073, partial [Tanacetum coccineum]